MKGCLGSNTTHHVPFDQTGRVYWEIKLVVFFSPKRSKLKQMKQILNSDIKSQQK